MNLNSLPPVFAVAPTANPQLHPTNPPTWFRKHVGREERPWHSWTGDVELMAGRRFPTVHASLDAALAHARRSSKGELGAVAVMARDGHFFLTRLFNVEFERGKGLVMRNTDISGRERGYSRFHPDMQAIVDGAALIRF